jgi:hypothetical protein
VTDIEEVTQNLHVGTPPWRRRVEIRENGYKMNSNRGRE